MDMEEQGGCLGRVPFGIQISIDINCAFDFVSCSSSKVQVPHARVVHNYMQTSPYNTDKMLFMSSRLNSFCIFASTVCEC